MVRRKAPGEFPKQTMDLLQTFAAQSVLAIQNARLFTEIGEKSHQLEVASQHKSQFLANMSHELRTPLNAILGYTELILDDIYGETPDKMRGVLERVQSNGKHLLGLINDVLDLSKIEAGQLTLSLTDYSIKDVVHSVFGAVESLANAKEARAQGRTAAGTCRPGTATSAGSPRSCSIWSATRSSSPMRAKSRSRRSAANGSYTVAVRDTGPGIAVADQAKIFEEFQQADSFGHPQEGRHRARLVDFQAHHRDARRAFLGRVRRSGEGSTFFVTVPVKVEQQVGHA